MVRAREEELTIEDVERLFDVVYPQMLIGYNPFGGTLPGYGHVVEMGGKTVELSFDSEYKRPRFGIHNLAGSNKMGVIAAVAIDGDLVKRIDEWDRDKKGRLVLKPNRRLRRMYESATRVHDDYLENGRRNYGAARELRELLSQYGGE